ncbi:hypothetical protein [Bacillus inaquosorum]|uniref:hypothetical protein n=1 Tax=Bacillus inaquosorum TaxID=483913 RepID=UPI00227DE6DB|nr:hypothetical protein [Bacillus inaquosorum]MCY7787457.1 hypothetical protein [Bacillus inaquosorum]
MNILIINTINKLYNEANLSQDNYPSLCKQPIILPKKIKSFVKTMKIQFENISMGEIWPSAAFQFEFPKYEKNEFHVNYTSKLIISKLAPVYYLQHQFTIENVDPERATPVLDGFSTQSYSMLQQKLDTKLNQILKEMGYNPLTYQEMNEVICDLDIKTEPLFGPQITVELALFHDLLELCPE